MSFLTKLLVISALLFSFSSAQAGAKSIAAIYGDFIKTVTKSCDKKYASDKSKARKCITMVEKDIAKDCGSKPWDKCFFKENGDYMEAGKSGSWTKVQNILDKAYAL